MIFVTKRRMTMRSVVGLSSAALLWCTVLGQAAGAGQGPDYRLFHDRGKDDAAAPAEGAKVNRLAPLAGDWSFTGGSELKCRLSSNPLQERRSAASMALNVGAGLKAWERSVIEDRPGLSLWAPKPEKAALTFPGTARPNVLRPSDLQILWSSEEAGKLKLTTTQALPRTPALLNFRAAELKR